MEHRSARIPQSKRKCYLLHKKRPCFFFDWDFIHEEITLDFYSSTSKAGPSDMDSDASAANILKLFVNADLVIILVEELNCIMQEIVTPAVFLKSNIHQLHSIISGRDYPFGLK